MPKDHEAGLGFPRDPPSASNRTLATHTFQAACLPSRNSHLPAAILPPQPEQVLFIRLQAVVLPRAGSGFYRSPGSPGEMSLGCSALSFLSFSPTPCPQ